MKKSIPYFLPSCLLFQPLVIRTLLGNFIKWKSLFPIFLPSCLLFQPLVIRALLGNLFNEKVLEHVLSCHEKYFFHMRKDPVNITVLSMSHSSIWEKLLLWIGICARGKNAARNYFGEGSIPRASWKLVCFNVHGRKVFSFLEHFYFSMQT
jgi:hypothetical protein